MRLMLTFLLQLQVDNRRVQLISSAFCSVLFRNKEKLTMRLITPIDVASARTSSIVPLFVWVCFLQFKSVGSRRAEGKQSCQGWRFSLFLQSLVSYKMKRMILVFFAAAEISFCCFNIVRVQILCFPRCLLSCRCLQQWDVRLLVLEPPDSLEPDSNRLLSGNNKTREKLDYNNRCLPGHGAVWYSKRGERPLPNWLYNYMYLYCS